MKFALLVSALAVIVAGQAAPTAKKGAAKAAAKAAKRVAKQQKRAAKQQAAANEAAKKAAEAKKPEAKPAQKPAEKAATPAAAPAAKKHRVHHREFENYTPKTARKDLLRAHAAWNDDNSRYSRKPPALPKTHGLHLKRYQDKTTHHRIIEKDASRKLSRIPQFPHHNNSTAKRVTFRRSDLDRRAINVQENCSAYSNQKLRDACQKRFGVYTDDTEKRHKSRIELAREKCATIKQANRKRMCWNTYLRNGGVPYFAQDAYEEDDEQEQNEDNEQEEAVDADAEGDAEDSEEGEDDGQGLMQVTAGEEADDEGEGEDEDDDDDLLQVEGDSDDESEEGEDDE